MNSAKPWLVSGSSPYFWNFSSFPIFYFFFLFSKERFKGLWGAQAKGPWPGGWGYIKIPPYFGINIIKKVHTIPCMQINYSKVEKKCRPHHTGKQWSSLQLVGMGHSVTWDPSTSFSQMMNSECNSGTSSWCWSERVCLAWALAAQSVLKALLLTEVPCYSGWHGFRSLSLALPADAVDRRIQNTPLIDWFYLTVSFKHSTGSAKAFSAFLKR